MNKRLLSILVFAVLVLPATAAADSTTIGSALTLAPTPGVCNNCVGVQRAQAGGATPFPLTSPVNGVVTSWSVRTNDAGALYTLRVLKPAGPTAYTGAGSSAASAATPSATDTVYTYPSSVAIASGDAIGLQTPVGYNLPNFTGMTNTTDVMGYATPIFADGATSAPLFDLPLHELLLQATVKFCKVPDLKGMKTVAAQQLLAAGDCAAGASKKKKLKRTKKNRKKKGKVLRQTVAAGTTAAPGTAVGFTVGKLKKK